MDTQTNPPPRADAGHGAAEAFSRKAAVYDAFGKDHPNLARMRKRVRDHVLHFAPPGAGMLELNAGTGADAAYFAERGLHVLATDIAPGMLEAIRARTVNPVLEGRLSVQACSFTELDRLGAGPFDIVFSNMGGLNCIPDLTAVTRHLPGLLRPGGMATFVIMPRVCPWEWLSLLKMDLSTATRRLTRDGVLANVEGVAVRTWYFPAAKARSAFGPDFRMVRLENLSLLTPPADRKAFAHRLPGIYRLLAALDDRLSTAPVLRGWGDFYVLTMRYRP